MELEQTETFDYKGNTGFEKRVKIHSSEFHEMQIEVSICMALSWGLYRKCIVDKVESNVNFNSIPRTCCSGNHTPPTDLKSI